MSEHYRKSSEEVMNTLGVTDKGLTSDEVKKDMNNLVLMS